MRWFFLLAFISVNLWAMKRVNSDNNYTDYKKEIVAQQGDKDLITNEPINYADSILIEKVKNNYMAYSVGFLYEWLFNRNKNTIPGLEIKVTDNQKELIKLYHEARPLAKDMTEDKIDKITTWLFRFYLDEGSENIASIISSLSENKEIYEIIIKDKFINDKGKLTEEGLRFLKRFLRYPHLKKEQFPFLNCSCAEEVEQKLKDKKLDHHWSLRKSTTYKDDNEGFSYCIVLMFIKQGVVIKQWRLFYKSGVGFSTELEKDESYRYTTNLLDMLNVFFDTNIIRQDYISNI